MPSKPLYFHWKNKHEILLPMNLSHLLLSQNALFIELIFFRSYILRYACTGHTIAKSAVKSAWMTRAGTGEFAISHLRSCKRDLFLPLFHDA